MKNKLKMFKRSVRNGAMEVQEDMSPAEVVVAVQGTKMAVVGGFGVLASKVAFGAVVAKGMLVMGSVMVGGAVVTGFVRGFSEQWQTLKRLET